MRSYQKHFLCTFVVLTTVFSIANAAVVDSVWIGGYSANWSDSTNWSTGIVPNNGTDTYNVSISNSDVNVNGIYSIDALSLDSLSSLSLVNSNQLTLSQDSINSGTIALSDNSSSAYNQAALKINGSITVDGTSADYGQIVFGSSYHNVITFTNATDILTVGQYQTIKTSALETVGTIYTDMINNGTLNADYGTLTLSAVNVTNNGLIEAQNGGVMSITSSTIDNSNGIIQSEAGSTVNFSSSSVTGGTINGTGTVNIDNTVNFDATSGILIEDVALNIGANDTLKANGNLTNNTTITLDDQGSSVYNSATLKLNGDLSLDGNGQILFASGYHNYITYTNTGDTLNLGTDQVITTADGANGTIYTALVNDGIVNADAGVITLSSYDKVNNNLLTATNGGTLNISSIGVDNNGTITADDTSTVNLSSSTITGGTVEGTGTVNIDNTVFLNAASGMQINDASVMVGTNDILKTSGNLTNNTTITLDDTGSSVYNAATLKLDGDLSLGGNGQILFASDYHNYITYTNVGDTLNLGSDQVITTADGANGSIYAALVNDGIVNADAGVITLFTYDKVNNTVLTATNGGTLNVNSINIDNNGKITVADTSTLNLNSSTITGGTIDGTGTVYVNNTVILDATAGLQIDDAQVMVGTVEVLKTSGNLTNNTTITLDDTSSSIYDNAALLLNGDLALDGNGQILFASGYHNDIRNTNTDDTLTLGSGQVITTNTGSNGIVYTKLVNNGIIDADAGTITLQSYDKVNNNVISTTNGGTLNVSNITIDNNGSIDVDDAGLLKLSSATITGGEISGTGTVEIAGISTLDGSAESVTLGNVTTTIRTSDTLLLKGQLTNNGTISINDTSSSTYDSSLLKINGDVTLDGTGQVVFDSGYHNNIVRTNYYDTLTIGAQQSIISAVSTNGSIQTQVDNHGTMSFAGSMAIGMAYAIHYNSGILEILNSTTSITGNSLTNQYGGIVRGNGTLNISGISFTNEGTLAAGCSVGTLSITGNYIQASTGSLEVEVAAADSYDIVNITGSADLAGIVDVSVLSYSNLTAGDILTILTTTDIITYSGLTLASNDTNAWNLILDDYSVQIQFIPEPATMLILAAGMVMLRSKKK